MWSEFKLEVLTIVFFPTSPIDGTSYGGFHDDEDISGEPKEFRKPAINSKMGRRATWICQYATKGLHDLKEEKLQQWTVPKIEYVCRVGGWLEKDYEEKDFDDDEAQSKNVNENQHDSGDLEDGAVSDRGSADYNKGPNGGHHLIIDDDSLWFKKAAAIMVHIEPSREMIKSLEQKYHSKWKKY